MAEEPTISDPATQEQAQDNEAAHGESTCEQEQSEEAPKDYLSEDNLIKHLKRQGRLLAESLQDRAEIPLDARELTHALEREIFAPRQTPRRQENGTCEANPRLNFYPTYAVPETLATYHIFFQNQKIPLSCRANRSRADELLTLHEGDSLPDYLTLEEVPKIFEGLGSEEIADSAALQERDSALVELKNDNPRLAVVKRSAALTHFAYPAMHLPPKVIEVVMNTLLIKRAKGGATADEALEDEDEGKPVVSDRDLSTWLKTNDPEKIEARRKTMLSVVLVSALLECMRRFFSPIESVKKMGETLHYAFRHGYVRLASQISNVEISNLISYLGVLHENRLGQAVLHTTLQGEAKRDYIRDTIFLMLVYTWQTAMGVWQQCLEDANLKELEKLLVRARRKLWSGDNERLIAQDLADIIFPAKLLHTLQNGLPDLMSQTMMQNFRSFILERSGMLPALTNALPTDFIPLTYKETPPNLWCYTYTLQLANFFMYHTDVASDVAGEGLLEHYCRCNLCTPHRCLATNTPLLNETQVIGTFEMRGPGGEGGTENPKGLKLTAGMWTSAFLRKFEPEDYYAHQIRFYENQSRPPKVEPSACVITQASILAQLQNIKKAREEFLLKKGQGVYLDPQTGEPLNAPEPSVDGQKQACSTSSHGRRGGSKSSRAHQRGRGTRRGQPVQQRERGGAAAATSETS